MKNIPCIMHFDGLSRARDGMPLAWTEIRLW